jgi:H+/gluconate symporter-like permease
MAKKIRKESEEIPPPSPGLAFLIGLMMFGAFLCPGGVILSYTIKLHRTLGTKLLESLSLGCFMGLVVAIIPAIIFMYLTMKKVKKY